MHHGGKGLARARRHLRYFDQGRRRPAPRIGEFQGLGCCTAAAPPARCPISRNESHPLESRHARHLGGDRRLLGLPCRKPGFLATKAQILKVSPAATIILSEARICESQDCPWL